MAKQDALRTMALLIIILSGCASQAPILPDLYWPAHPEEPRIAFVAVYRGTADFRASSFLDRIFGSTTKADLPRPYAVTASGGKIYVADMTNKVVVIDPGEKDISYIGGTGDKSLILPLGIASAADGLLYVSDAKAMRINVYDKSGKLKSVIGNKNELQNPVGLAVNNELGRIYVADSKAHSVVVYSTRGELLFRIGKRGTEDGNFNFPNFIAVDRRNGNVVVVDSENARVQIFDRDGKFIRKFGEPGDSLGTFSRPKGVGVDSDGNIYVVDASFNVFQIFDEKGQTLLSIGSPGRDRGQFSLPAGMYIDEKDVIYVADQFNGRVQVFQYLSDKWKKGHPEEYKKYLLQERDAPQTGEPANDTQKKK